MIRHPVVVLMMLLLASCSGSSAQGEIILTGDLPHEGAFRNLDAFDLYYGVADMDDGARLRTMIASPHGASGPLPAIFVTQWVSCGSITDYFGRRWDGILDAISGDLNVAIILVDRASDGDSIGSECEELDYDTEVSHYVQAFKQLVSHELIDETKVVIHGSSLGATIAPLVAQKLIEGGGKVAGLIVQGGGALTYFERMVNFDRYYLERRPNDVTPSSIHSEMNDRIVFQTEYLLKGRSPDDVAKDSPRMTQIRNDIRGMENGSHYGRPYAYHQQAAQKDFLSAWIQVAVPVLVIFNEYDQFESEHGHKLIVDMINRVRPGTATYIRQNGLGHSNFRFDTITDAYADETGKYNPEPMRIQMINWLQEKILGKL